MKKKLFLFNLKQIIISNTNKYLKLFKEIEIVVLIFSILINYFTNNKLLGIIILGIFYVLYEKLYYKVNLYKILPSILKILIYLIILDFTNLFKSI